MKNFLFDDLGPTVAGMIVISIALIVVFIGGATWLAVVVDRSSCRTAGENAGVNVKYDFPAGCFVEVNNKWIPADRWIENTGN